ncbi:MAG TPA: hypothetical protein VI076_00180 [Actinopolymorphaceae bacterium]
MLSDTLWAPEPRHAPVFVPPSEPSTTPQPDSQTSQHEPSVPPRPQIVFEIEDDSPSRRGLYVGGIIGLVVLIGVVGALWWTSGEQGSGPAQPRTTTSMTTATSPRPTTAAPSPTPSGADLRTVPSTPSPSQSLESTSRPRFSPLGGAWETSGDAERLVPHGQAQQYITEKDYRGTEDWMAIVFTGEFPLELQASPDLRTSAATVADWYANIGFGGVNAPEFARTGGHTATVAGRPAYVLEGRVGYRIEGLKARADLVRIVVLDLGEDRRPSLFVASVPDTHRRIWKDVDAAMASLRLIG